MKTDHSMGGATITSPGRLDRFDFRAVRALFPGPWIANNFYDPDRAARSLAAGAADLISFGRPFIANPDLVERVRRGSPLNEVNLATLYAGRSARGYTDYPAVSETPDEPAPA
jgi:N-ethylmaleimide reductase